MDMVGSSTLNGTRTLALRLLQDVDKPSTKATASDPSAGSSYPVTLLDDREGADVDEFIYNALGKLSNARTSSDVIGLLPPGPEQFQHPEAANHPSKLKFEIRIGDVVLARVYEGGVAELTDGFDYSSIGFAGEEESGLEGMDLATDRTNRIIKFFADLVGAKPMDARATLIIQLPLSGVWINGHATSGHETADPILSSNKRLISLMVEADRVQRAIDGKKETASAEIDRRYVPDDITEDELAKLSDGEYLALLKQGIAALIGDSFGQIYGNSIHEAYIYSPAIVSISIGAEQ